MPDSTFLEGTFGYDADFLKKHKDLIVLTAPDNDKAQVALTAGYQGRVMTSTATGAEGYSYGWLNYSLIKSGIHEPHMNAFGGEERFWLSPEGGQFSVFFEKGKPFDFEHWQTPSCIDSVAYQVSAVGDVAVTFEAEASFDNYSGTHFDIGINRSISLLDRISIVSRLNLKSIGDLECVAYESVNVIVNRGGDWASEVGLLGIWLLGMFKPSDYTTLIVPIERPQTGPLQMTDDYFGSIPPDRLVVSEKAIYMKGDGHYRGKIGVSPASACNVAGSYDAQKQILTIIQYDLDPAGAYMNAKWEIHKEPYRGDVLNAYNDGPLEDGSRMGPFYELESSSSVLPLKHGERLTHRQTTYHFEGDSVHIDVIAREVLGVGLNEISGVFD